MRRGLSSKFFDHLLLKEVSAEPLRPPHIFFIEHQASEPHVQIRSCLRCCDLSEPY